MNVFFAQIENLEDLLKEKDNQVDMARARLAAMQHHHCNSEGALTSLEETIGDKDRQMQQLRDQRDRAEKDKEEERDLHEREIAEYKLKLHSLESDMEKLNSRLDRVLVEKDRLESRLESSQSELGKSKAELDKASSDVGRSTGDWKATEQRLARLELENERLRHELERSQVSRLSSFAKYAMGNNLLFSSSAEDHIRPIHFDHIAGAGSGSGTCR